MEVDISMNVEGVLMEFLRSDEKCAKHCWKLVVQYPSDVPSEPQDVCL